MRTEPLDYRTNHRLQGVAATVAIHLIVAVGWWLSGRGDPPADEAAESIQWIDIPAPKRVAVAPAAPSPPVAKPVKPVPPRRMPATPVPRPTAAPALDIVPDTSAPATVAAPEAAPAKSVHDMLQQARRDIGKIDKDLKKEFPERGMWDPLESTCRHASLSIL